MEATAYSKFQRFGARKVAQVLGNIRGKSYRDAQHLLPVLSRSCAVMVGKTLKSAYANLLVRLGKPLEPEQVWVKSCWVGQGPMKGLKRIQPGPQGRAMPYKRKMCHLTITVADQASKPNGSKI